MIAETRWRGVAAFFSACRTCALYSAMMKRIAVIIRSFLFSK